MSADPERATTPRTPLRFLGRWVLPIVVLAALVAFLLTRVTTTVPPAPTQSTAPMPAAAPDVDEKFLEAYGMRYWLAVKTEPRPLRIHHLRIDLAQRRVDLVAAPSEDPDGAGPATGILTPSMMLADRTQAIGLVNANPWQSLPDAEGERQTDWREGLPVEILGLVVARGEVRSAPAERYCAFWIDRAGKPHVGNPPDLAQVREGVAGFLRLLDAGRNLHHPDDKMHPRTALGLDADARFIVLVVVDGRQPGYSEGMNYFELADYMKSLGCADVVNLDGGGSSIMILADAKGARRVVNDPSTKQDGVSIPRPIPVALAVRANK